MTLPERLFERKGTKIIFLSPSRSTKTALITFEGVRTETDCRLSHTERFGMQTPVVGSVLNFLIFKNLYRKKAN